MDTLTALNVMLWLVVIILPALWLWLIVTAGGVKKFFSAERPTTQYHEATSVTARIALTVSLAVIFLVLLS